MDLYVKLTMTEVEIKAACLEWADRKLPKVEGMHPEVQLESYLGRATITLVKDEEKAGKDE